MAIDKEMLIGELIHVDENIPAILMRAGMHCLGCPSSRGETVEQAKQRLAKKQQEREHQ